ncbi:MAG: helix-turn-helix domain-containing protein [Actinomycetota bacterium]|nr:helix-turn-helix domain-containing protein [Actinomycetota bacterium]
MTATLSGIPPSSMLDRFTVIIDCFGGGTELLTLDEIAARTGLPRSSAHRILDQLVRLDWLTHCARGYGLGLRALPWPVDPAGDIRIRAAAAPALHELLMRTGAVVHLGVLDRGDIVHLDKLGGSMSARVPTAVGMRRPAHDLALGIAALAGLAPEEAATELDQGRSGFAPGPRWWRELHRARAAAVVCDGDYAAGLVAVAATVGGRASVGIVTTADRVTHRERSLVGAAAARIRRALTASSVGAE